MCVLVVTGKGKIEETLALEGMCDIKYHTFGLNRTENFLTCHFTFWGIRVCVGGGCARSCSLSFSLVNTFG